MSLAQVAGGYRIRPTDLLMSWVEELILVMGADCRNPATGLAGGVFGNYPPHLCLYLAFSSVLGVFTTWCLVTLGKVEL